MGPRPTREEGTIRPRPLWEAGARKRCAGTGKGRIMVRIAVVEDELEQRNTICAYLDKLSEEQGCAFQVTAFESGAKLLFDYTPVYDVILMDIEMPGIDGMRTAMKVREQDSEVILIFITNMAQYAIQGYKVRAQAYLLKPVNYYSFAMEIQDALRTLSRRESGASLLLPWEDGMKRVQLRDIYYIESQRHNLRVHAADGTYEVRETMKNMTEQLSGKSFVRSGVSYLVNLANVSGIQGDLAIVGPERVPISRQKRKEFLSALSNYIGGINNDIA